MKTPYFIYGMSLFLMTACAPQAELVKTGSELADLREQMKASQARLQELQKHEDDVRKRVETLDTNAKGTGDIEKSIADYGAKTDQLSTDIQLLQGKLEENNFKIADVGQKLDDKTFKIAELSSRVDDLEARLKSLSGSQALSSKGTATAEKKLESKPLEPSEAYRQAMNDYNSGSFDLALAGFQNYLVQFPDASQAAQAQYWAGECLYAKKEFQNAIEAFSKVIKNYPKSEKVPGSKLKIGYSYLSLNNTAKAKEWLQRVVREYPGSREADLAKEKLYKIGK
jgi:tol-pal system protein YbgF